MKKSAWVLLAGLLATSVRAQSTWFSFDDAPAHVSLPLALTSGGITAQFSATAQGFSIQPANTLGFTPAGFSGNCIYPNSVYAADLLISFSLPLSDFSILYAPEEYACDSSATMRVTAYMNGSLVATATTNAPAGTWPSQTLSINLAAGFNSVVVHYDAPPVTGGDWGPIFMADNMNVLPLPAPILLTSPTWLPGSGFSFGFTAAPATSFSVLGSSDPALPLANWAVLGTATETAPGQYQFIHASAPSGGQQFYRVRSP
jgi:hypothetical protein